MAAMTDDPGPEFRAGGDELRDAGFRWGPIGTHTSRTIMLDELRALLSSCSPEATRQDYLAAIQDDNCLAKRTVATRRLSAQRLTELYALEPDILLFSILRELWYLDREGQPLLALLVALARDPLLRATAEPILRMQPHEELARQQLTDALQRTVGNRLSESTLDKVVRNSASSWTQSGHLKGRGRKVRQLATPTPATAALALLLGYLSGTRGSLLFETIWARVLDAPSGEFMQLAVDARRLGLMDIRQSGGVTEVAFTRLLTPAERR